MPTEYDEVLSIIFSRKKGEEDYTARINLGIGKEKFRSMSPDQVFNILWTAKHTGAVTDAD